jgi:SAM-dependent methyltransferase
MPNADNRVVEDFGREWQLFDQSGLDEREAIAAFDQYFLVFPWAAVPSNAEGFDLGCGSGRWARIMAPRVGRLHCIEPSEAIKVARRVLAEHSNVSFHQSYVDSIPLADASMDFGYSLGVLHHVPDTPAGIRACVGKLKPGAPFLLYLYYAFDNRPAWFRMLWRISDAARRVICRLPFLMKRVIASAIAAFIYWPLARVTKFVESRGSDVSSYPLSYYRDRSFYVMRTDSLDRFGTRIEKRFRREEILAMMEAAGLERIQFSPSAPYWCAVGYRSNTGATQRAQS